MPIPGADSVPSNKRWSADHTAECSSMRTAGPAAWTPHALFELRAHPLDMLPPGLIFLDGDGPADPLVARERRYVFPGRKCLRVGCESLSEISRKVVNDSSGNSSGCHRVILQATGSSIQKETEMQVQQKGGVDKRPGLSAFSFRGLKAPAPSANTKPHRLVSLPAGRRARWTTDMRVQLGFRDHRRQLVS